MLTYYDISGNVTAFSTTRHGGYGKGAYGGMNINRFCGDDKNAICKNIELLSKELNVAKEHIIMPHQTHETKLALISKEFLLSSETEKATSLEGIDALMTQEREVCIGVSTADCIPIIIYDPEHHAAATVHAGWRGTVKRIAEKAVEEMKQAFGSRPELLKAVIGPGISVEAFEVGDEVYDEFASSGFNMREISLRKDKWHIDLPKCNRLQLTGSGLTGNNITETKICTFNNFEDYFSARRLGTKSGRIFTGIILH